MANLLEVKDLVIDFQIEKNTVTAVHGISFSVKKGETLCIVGESGCGKSITSLSVMDLLPSNGSVSRGSIVLNGEDLTKKTEEQMRNMRGNELSMIFQEPMTALNPVYTIGFQLREPFMIHKNLSKKKADDAAVSMLEKVGMPNPREVLRKYPHELSGGMRQRVMIAMALACQPNLLIADEPTTALDVTIQAQILDLIEELKEEMDMGVIFVTHDMGVVAEIADRVMVMYSGEVVEVGTVEEVFNDPQHPYTKGLLASVPNVDDAEHELHSIPGTLPNIQTNIQGCRFHERCAFATEKCIEQAPPLFEVSKSHQSKCWLQEG